MSLRKTSDEELRERFQDIKRKFAHGSWPSREELTEFDVLGNELYRRDVNLKARLDRAEAEELLRRGRFGGEPLSEKQRRLLAILQGEIKP